MLDACDHLILVSVDRNKLSVDPQKVTFLPNGFDAIDFDIKKTDFPEVFTICYTGTIANSYPTAQLLKAFKSLRSHTAFKLLFVGKVTETVKKDFSDCLEDAVEFVDFVSHREAIDFMISSWVLLLMIPQTENSRFIIPGKVFEYLATGRSVLVVGSPDSIAAQIVRQANAGAAFDDDDAAGMTDYLFQQYQSYLDRKYPETDFNFIQGFSRKSLTAKIAGIIFEC